MKNWKPNLNKEFLRRHLGSMSQLAGLKRYELTEARSKGVEAVDVRTGSGFEYTILPGRGMDIAWASYKGVPISYISKADISAPAYYETEGLEWLRGFYAGMMTTCGFANVGGPCEEERHVFGLQKYGLHGRLSNLPASETSTWEVWNADKYIMSVEGKLTESVVHGERLTLRRRISSVLGESRITIHDIIENEGNQPQPVMLLYHINVGYPLLGESTRLIINSSDICPASDEALAELADYNRFHEPKNKQNERCYFHDVKQLPNGKAMAAVVNDELALGIAITYSGNQLPCLTEWKMPSQGEYVLGIEPGNVNPIGRVEARRQKRLEFLQPGQIKKTDIEIRILDGEDEIEEVEAFIREC